MALSSSKASLVPLGIQLQEWSRGMEPSTSKTRSAPGKGYTMVNETMTNDRSAGSGIGSPFNSNTETFYTVTTAPSDKASERRRRKTELLDYSSAIKMALDRTREKEAMSEGMSHNEVSLDSASVTTGLSASRKRKSPASSSSSSSSTSSAGRNLIKRVKQSSGAQSASRKQAGKTTKTKSSSAKKGTKKKKKN